MKILHTADLQLGANFERFGSAVGAKLAEARFVTLERILKLAAERSVDAVVIAGDLFEDSFVDETVVRRAAEIFERNASAPIVIVPGNHDPATGSASIWARKALAALSNHVRVVLNPEAHAVGDGTLLCIPLRQKKSTLDPTGGFPALLAVISGDGPVMGITHGSPKVEGQHQHDDFPIALDAATRHGLDYLGIGHWHGWREFDNGRMIMPGTPEPDRFGQDQAGSVALATLSRRGEVPKVERIVVEHFRWREVTVDVAGESGRIAAKLAATMGDHSRERVLTRLILEGVVTPELMAACSLEIAAASASLAFTHCEDQTQIRLSAGALAALAEAHPSLGELMGDVQQIRSAVTQTAMPERIGAGLTLSQLGAAAKAADVALEGLSTADVDAMESLLHDALSQLNEEESAVAP